MAHNAKVFYKATRQQILSRTKLQMLTHTLIVEKRALNGFRQNNLLLSRIAFVIFIKVRCHQGANSRR